MTRYLGEQTQRDEANRQTNSSSVGFNCEEKQRTAGLESHDSDKLKRNGPANKKSAPEDKRRRKDVAELS